MLAFGGSSRKFVPIRCDASATAGIQAKGQLFGSIVPSVWDSKSNRVLRRTSWSLVDQGVVSLGTFLISIILARHLSSPEYGVFAVLMTAAFNLQLLSIWLVAYPLVVRLAGAVGEERARLLTSSVTLVLVLCVPMSGLIAIALIVFGRADLVAPGVMWFTLWQSQQAARRALLADMGHSKAIAGDVLSSLGQVLIVGVIGVVGDLSLREALYGMAAASFLGAAHQIFKLHPVFNGLYGPRDWLLQNASHGAWSLAAGFVSLLRVHLLLWLLAMIAGAAVVAHLQAAINVFNLLNPIQFGLSNIVPQVTAAAYAHREKRTAWYAARPYVLISLPPTLVYVALAVIFAPFLLGAFYGSNSPYLDVGGFFPPLAVFSSAMMATELVICYFLGIGEALRVLRINLVGSAATAVLAGPLIATFGMLEGACLTLAASELIRLAVTVVSLRRVIGREPNRHLEALGEPLSKTN